jgi:uncharacterized protein (TIGR00730 family)
MEAPAFRRICVYTGSNRGARGAYTEHAWCLGQLLARRGIGLVYGGGRVGLMGVVADAALQAGGEVIGVIPEALVAKEIAHPSLSDLRVVRSMHERKAVMSDLSDAFVALPGGFGTFEELFEIVTWSQLGILTKPVGLLNTEGFYDPLIALVEHAAREGFIHERHAALVTAATDPTDLIDELERWKPPPTVSKWLSKSQT